MPEKNAAAMRAKGAETRDPLHEKCANVLKYPENLDTS